MTMTSWRQRSQYTSGTCSSAAAREVALELRGVAGLAHQVELVQDRLLVLDDDLARPQAPRVRPVLLGEAGEGVQHLEVEVDRLAHAGPQHLDDDLAPVRERRRVDLGDGGRRERRGIEAREELRDRPAERGLDARLGERAVEGRDAVLELRELVGDVGRQQVAPRRDDLAELHEDRPEVLERAPQALAARAAAAREPGPGRQPEDEAQRAVEVGRAHVVVEPVAHQHAVDGEQPAGDPHRDHAGPCARIGGRDPRFEAIHGLAQPVHVLEELLDLDAHRQVAALLGQVLGGVAREACRRRAARTPPHRAQSPRGSARRRRP